MQTQPSVEQFAKLLVVDPNVISLLEYILKTDICTIGRRRTCDVVVTLEIASRLHAEIRREGPRYNLYDKSTNGTFVNNCRIDKSCILQSGDTIGLGSTTPILRFYDPVDDPPTPLAALPTPNLLIGLCFYEATMSFCLDEQPLELTPQEFRLLYYLYQHAGEVCSREDCAQVIWGQNYNQPHQLVDWKESLNRKVADVRGKLRAINPAVAKIIETRRTFGYRLNLYLPSDQ